MNEKHFILSKEQKENIVAKLVEKGVRLICPMCGNNNFVIADGYFNHTIQKEFVGGMVVGGPAIPTIGIICSKCGFTSQHALGALGLLPKKEEVDNE